MSTALSGVAAFLGIVSLGLLTAACGGAAGSHVAQLDTTTTRATLSNASTASTHQSGWLAFSRCMRSHGVARFPDPTDTGALPKVSAQQLGVGSSQLQSAQTACRNLRPTSGSLRQETDCLMLGNCSPAEVQRMLAAERRYARCMRSHGVSSWPDPSLNSQGMPVFDVTRAGIARQFIHSSLFRSPNGTCQRLTGGAPVPRE